MFYVCKTVYGSDSFGLAIYCEKMEFSNADLGQDNNWNPYGMNGLDEKLRMRETNDGNA